MQKFAERPLQLRRELAVDLPSVNHENLGELRLDQEVIALSLMFFSNSMHMFTFLRDQQQFRSYSLSHVLFNNANRFFRLKIQIVKDQATFAARGL